MEVSQLHTQLSAALGDKVLGREELTDREATVLAPSAWAEGVKLLVGLGFDVMIELGGADYSNYPEPKAAPLCVSAHFYSTASNARAWIKAYLPLEGAEIESLVPQFAAANWYERECYDMFGVQFKNHPYLKRLLLYDEFVGHPLRKDYPIMKSQPLIPMRSAVDYEAVAMKRRAEEGKA
jgi:NADH-quinone oxidoreductase subunit C